MTADGVSDRAMVVGTSVGVLVGITEGAVYF